MSDIELVQDVISQKPKQPFVAAIFGLFFGPISTLYFGWKILLATLGVFTVSILLVSWFFPFPIPTWFVYIDNVFFAILNFVLAHVLNENLRTEDTSISPTMIILMSMVGWYIRFCTVFMGFYSAFLLFQEGRWVIALLVVFLGIGITIWLFQAIFAFLLTFIPLGLAGVSSFCLTSWEKFPEWVKWIFCWPLILILFVCGAIFSMFVSHSILIIMPDQFSKLLSPSLAAFLVTPIFFLLIYLFVPKKPALITGILVFLNSAYGIYFFINLYFIFNDDKWMGLRSDADYQLPNILVVAASLLLSWYWFFYFKRMNEKKVSGE